LEQNELAAVGWIWISSES